MTRNAEAITAGLNAVDPSTFPIASPWSDPGDLAKIIAADVFGVDGPPVNSRTAAMRIPAVARGRNLMVSTICRFPLESATVDTLDAEQPTWLYRTTDGTSPELRMAWTVDDLIFYGWSCWWRANNADGFPGDVGRIPYEDWTINRERRCVEVNGIPQPNDAVILIPGLHEGILSFGADTIRDARNLYDVVRTRLDMPVPNIDLHQTGGDPLSKEERDELVEAWGAARRLRRGGVAYTSEHIEAKELGKGGEELMIEARNAAALDLARMIGVTAGLIDATAPKASLNYETTTGRNQEFVDRDLALYMTPITARLSMDDVSPRGRRVRFNLADYTAPAPSPTGPIAQD